MRKITFIAFFSFYFYCVSFAQQVQVGGLVFDASTKESLPYVNVSFPGTTIGTTSDLDGVFSLQSEKKVDSIAFSFVGYQPLVLKLKDRYDLSMEVYLSPLNIELAEVKIKAGRKRDNPALPIIRGLWANKKNNNPDKLDAYEYEVYNKVEFDMNNLSEKFMNKKVFKPFDFIFDNIDSTGDKPYLPVFISESISKYYYRRNPISRYEEIEATKVSGLDNESVNQFLGDMYQKANVYENNLRFFGKSFISPISKTGFLFYNYYLLDSLDYEGDPCYHLKFLPKRNGEPLFKGDLWIIKGDYALRKISAEMAGLVNINFIRGFAFEQEYNAIDKDNWLLVKDKLIVDFSIDRKSMGFFGRKTTTYNNFILNKPRDPSFYDAATPVVVKEGSRDKTEAYWQEARHENLTESEEAIYLMVDSLKKVPRFNTYLDIINIAFTGYKVVGLVEIGPYSKLYSYNPVEGNRFRIGGRTSNKFSTRMAFDGFLARGLTDKAWKYGGGFLFFVSKTPRSILGAQYSKDVQQLGQSPKAFDQDNVFSSLFRRSPATKLTFENMWHAYYWHEWIPGFSNKVDYSVRELQSLGDLVYIKPDTEGLTAEDTISKIRTTELSFYTRFAFRERFVSGEFDRISLGSKYPIVEVGVNLGMNHASGGMYDYQKLTLSLSDETPFGLLGDLNWYVEAGKVFGKAPYPLLKIHTGNETFFLEQLAFNGMNFFEFVSDEYVLVHATHHFEGLFLNHIPLLKRLKWREVVSANAVWGTYNKRNNKTLLLPDYIFTLEEKPYLEATLGIENIFKFLRVDALWRLSYLDNPNIVKFGIRARLQLTF